MFSVLKRTVSIKNVVEAVGMHMLILAFAALMCDKYQHFKARNSSNADFKAFAHDLIERPSYITVKLYLIIGFVLNKLDCDYY